MYYLLKRDIQELNIKIGRDAFNAYLKRHNMLVKLKKSYTKTTNSSHWLRKHPNLYKYIKPEDPKNSLSVISLTLKVGKRHTTYHW